MICYCYCYLKLTNSFKTDDIRKTTNPLSAQGETVKLIIGLLSLMLTAEAFALSCSIMTSNLSANCKSSGLAG